ncbi:MAG TPA: response regulator transcription factor [Pyrinomonadaceae bacterium]
MPNSVLIIEDDPDIAESLRICLQSDRVDARVVYTGEDGLTASLDKNSPPSAILLDLLLPGMNGLELCRRLRRESSTRTTPIIFLTAKTSGADVSSCFDAGADDYVMKPFSIRALLKRINTILTRNQKEPVQVYNDGVLKIDFVERRVFLNGSLLAVVGFDFSLLAELAAVPGRVKTSQELATQFWQTEGRTPDWTYDLTSQRLQQLTRICSGVEAVSSCAYRFIGHRGAQVTQ